MKNYISILLIIGIILVLNLLSKELYFRADLTDNNQYTLSKATKDILKELDEVVTVKAFFSEGMPPDYSKLKNDLRDLLVEYARISGGNVTYSFPEPGSETFEQEAAEEGVPSFSMQVREKDKVELKNVFLGVSVNVGNQKDVIPQLSPNSPLEFMFTTVIKKLSAIEKPPVGLIQGHGEPDRTQLGQVAQGLEVLYTMEPVTLDAQIPAKYKTLMMVAPKDSFPDAHFQALDDFLGRGGNLYIAMNRVDAELNQQPPQATSVTTGLETWLANKGLDVQEAMIADVNYGTQLTMQRPVNHPIFGQIMQQIPVPFHYVPVIKNFNQEVPAVSGLESVILQFVSPIVYTGQDASLKFTPLAFTSNQSVSYPLPHYFNFEKKWTDADWTQPNIVVAGTLEGPINGGANSQIFLVADGDFAVNSSGNQQARLPEENINFMVNAVDWLSDDSGLIDLRTRAVASRPIEELEDGKRNMYKWLNFVLPLLAVIILGIVRMQRQRNRRLKRMQERYV